MSNLLTKNITLGVEPTEAIPGRPAYCTDTTGTEFMSFLDQFLSGLIPALPPVPPGENASIGTGHGWLETHGSIVTSYSHVCHNAVPPVPGDPGIPTNYHTGWTGAARSIASIAHDGQFQFSVPATVSGVVAGFNDVDTSTSYTEIDYAIYCASGKFSVVEGGAIRTAPANYVTSDVFTIARVGTGVRYYQNSTLVYTSTVPTADVWLFADCSLYFGGDSIVNASITDTVDAAKATQTGVVNDTISASMQAADGGYVQDSIDPTTAAVGQPYGIVNDNIGEIATQGVGFDAVTIADTIDIVTVAIAELFEPQFAAVALNLGELETFGAGVGDGHAGSVQDNLGTFSTYAANGNFGRINDNINETLFAWDFSSTGNVNNVIETLRLTDVLQSIPGNVVVESLALTDASAQTITLNQNVVAAIALSAEVVQDIDQNVTETLALTTASAQTVASKLVETLALTTATAGTSIQSSDVVETLALTDQLGDASAQHVIQNISTTLALSTVEVASSDKDITETLAFSVVAALNQTDSAVTRIRLSSALTEQVGQTQAETLALTATVAQQITQNIAETVSGSAGESLVLTDAYAQTISLTTNAVETVALSVQSQNGPQTNTVETLALTDVLSLLHRLAQNLAETLALADTYARNVTTALVESLAMSETSSQQIAALTDSSELVYLSEIMTGGGQSGGTGGVATSGHTGAWHAPLEVWAMSRFTNYSFFESMAVVDGVLLGAGEDGIYRLDANTDAGTPIDASVVHDWLDEVAGHGGDPVTEERLKRARYFYVNGKTDGQLALTVGYVDANGDEKSARYRCEMRWQTGYSNTRAELGRGIRSRYLQPTWGNVNGADFTVNGAKVIVDLCSRTM